MFTHIENKKIWVISLINIQTKEFRLIPLLKRDSTTLKTIVQIFIKRGNTIISDAWQAMIGLVYQILGICI